VKRHRTGNAPEADEERSPSTEEKKIVMENLIGMKRAGADMIITYHALDVAEWIQKGEV